MASTRWVGIDEAGWAPNLGPLVMTAVVAESERQRPPNLWADLAATVARARGKPEAVWVDDSKEIFKARQGFDRLEAGSLAALAACGKPLPAALSGLLEALGAGSAVDVELVHWLDGQPEPPVPRPESLARLASALERQPFDCARWKLCSVHTIVVGPERFNTELEAGGSKTCAHFWAFSKLLSALWTQASDGTHTRVRSDKHGGRNAYLELLYRAMPDAWIDRGTESAQASHYTARDQTRRLELLFQPRADGCDGLVALASMISKMVRERWMEVFNAYWAARIPELKPTAGYPTDAARFRALIEPLCRTQGLHPRTWWREK